MTFYNTNKERGAELQASRRQTNRQENIILEHYRQRPDCPISPSQIFQIHNEWPLTSIRRAITNLTLAGYLTKTSYMNIGIYGKKEHCWKLKPSAFKETFFDE